MVTTTTLPGLLGTGALINLKMLNSVKSTFDSGVTSCPVHASLEAMNVETDSNLDQTFELCPPQLLRQDLIQLLEKAPRGEINQDLTGSVRS